MRLHKLIEAEASHCRDLNEARMRVYRKVFLAKDDKGDFKFDPRRMSLKGLHEAFSAPVAGFGGGDPFQAMLQETTAPHVSSAFHLIATNIVQREFEAASDITSHLIGDQIVTKVEATSPEEPSTGLQALDDPKEFAEGEEVPNAKFKGQRSFKAPEPSYVGMAVSLTENMVKYDRMGLFLRRVGAVRDKLAVNREIRRLRALADHSANQRYYPYDEDTQGYGRVALWRTAATAGKWYARHITQISNPVGNEAKLQAVMDNFNARTDESGAVQSTLITQVLFPVSKQMAALKMMGFTNFLLGGTDADHSKVGGALTAAQILGGMPTPIFSKYLDAVTGAAGSWFIGNLRAHLVERVVHDLTVRQASMSHAELFDKLLYGKWQAFYQANVQVEGDDNLLRCAA